MKRKYAVGDKVIIRDYYDDSYPEPVFTVVRLNGRGYNAQFDVGPDENERYVTARDILRIVTPLEELL